MSGLVTGLQNRAQRFESASDLIKNKDRLMGYPSVGQFFILI